MASPLDLINKARARSAEEAPGVGGSSSSSSSIGGGEGESGPAAPAPPPASSASSSVMALVAAANDNNNLNRSRGDRHQGPLVVRDYDLSDAKKDAARVVEKIANSQTAQVAMQLAALGLEKASGKASKVAEKAKTSYAKGRAAAKARFTSDGSEWINETLAGSGGVASQAPTLSSSSPPSTEDGAESSGQTRTRKDSAIDAVRGVLESDLAKMAITAGAHAFVAAAGSKIGIPPTMSNMAAAETIETGVDHLQKNSSAAATATVEFGMDHLPDAAGVIGGVTTAAAETLPGLAEDAAATALLAAGMASRLASASVEALRQASSKEDLGSGTVEDGPEIAIVEEEQVQQRGHVQQSSYVDARMLAVESSSEEEETSDLSDNDVWEDAK